MKVLGILQNLWVKDPARVKPFYPPAMVPLSAIMERLKDAPVFRDLPEQVQTICRKVRKERYGIE